MESGKPIVQLTGEDGNIFFIVGRCRRALKDVGLHDKAEEMTKRVMAAGSYDASLTIVQEYVEAA